eukprot:1187545-Prorocentrum_minimum.AAC.2
MAAAHHALCALFKRGWGADDRVPVRERRQQERDQRQRPDAFRDGGAAVGRGPEGKGAGLPQLDAHRRRRARGTSAMRH